MITTETALKEFFRGEDVLPDEEFETLFEEARIEPRSSRKAPLFRTSDGALWYREEELERFRAERPRYIVRIYPRR